MKYPGAFAVYRVMQKIIHKCCRVMLASVFYDQNIRLLVVYITSMNGFRQLQWPSIFSETGLISS